MWLTGRKNKLNHVNNKGSALVSVLVVCTFITIIATTMLYVAAQNYQMKLTDYQNKQSFYGAEKALDELKAVLALDVQDAYLVAYNDTMKNFLKLDALGLDAKEHYQQAFIDELDRIWNERLAVIAPTMPASSREKQILQAIKDIMSVNGCDSAEVDNVYVVADFGVYEGTEPKDDGHGGTIDVTSDKFALKGVQVKCTVGNYTSFIYTDICLEAPAINLTAKNSTITTEAAKERETIAMTDYVVFMNWRKADYDETYDINIGTKK